MAYGFIGAGNMAGAIMRGMISAGYAPADILVSDSRPEAPAALAQELGLRAANSNAEVAAESEYLILAVKPQVLAPVLAGIQQVLAAHKPVIVSIAVGTTLSRLASYCPPGMEIVRVMPNVNAQIGAGMAAVCHNELASEAAVNEVLRIFNSVGRAISLPEKDMAAFAAVAGAGPALAYEFIDALATGALKFGIPKALAVEIAAQTVLGSAKLVLASDSTPADLRDTVTSPGGTTIAGLVAAEDAGFGSSVVRFVDGAVARDTELSS